MDSAGSVSIGTKAPKGKAYEHEGAVKFRMEREPILIPDLVVGDVRRELTDREALDPKLKVPRPKGVIDDGREVFL